MTFDPFRSLADLHADYASGAADPVAVTRDHLARIAALEPKLAAFVRVEAASALQAASESAARWRAGRPLGPLDGASVTIKDNADIEGLPTLHGSRVVDPAPATEDAPAVARLKEAGAIILGKTRLPEFGWKGITDTPLHDEPTRNPWDLSRSPGGSSGGAAAALAAGIGAIAFGNDGGGSIRIPASLSGLYGIKPTFGRVPHHRQEGFFSTIVAGGPIARRVADAVAMLKVLVGPDDRDYYALPPPPADWLDNLAPRLYGLSFAYAPALGGVAPDAEVGAVVEATISRLRDAGARIVEVGPVIDDLRKTFEPYWLAGFARRLRAIPRDRWEDLDPGFRALAERGLAITVDQVIAGDVARVELWRRFQDLHREHDLLLTPTTPRAAPLVETVYHSQGYDRWTAAVPYTVPFNLTGQPAASILCGLTPAGLPVGLQIVGRKYSDRLILEASLAVEAELSLPIPHPVLHSRLGRLG